MNAILECDGLTAGYEGKPIIRDFSLTLGEGEIVGLLGPNGAGKTTLLLTLAGFLPTIGGSITLGGGDISRTKATARARLGLVLVPDDRALFTTMTVKENLVLATRKGGLTVNDALEYFPQLDSRLRVEAGKLSGGEQQMLAIARALIQRPRALLIDELSMGLAPVVVERLLPTIRKIATDTKTSVILVEQHVQMALEVADRAVVLVHGQTLLEGDAASLGSDPDQLKAAYLNA
jgi:branched-chain amino acid transport system ATP-binding protein